MIALKTNLNNLVVERVMQVLSAHTEFYETSNMVFQGLKPQVDALKSKLSVVCNRVVYLELAETP